jgi:opacity protein-like surface antigen
MKYFSMIVAVLVMLQTTAMAEESVYFKKGDWELGFSGSYNNVRIKSGDTKEDVNLFFADLKASYFVIDNLSVGMGLVWLYLPKVEGISAYAIGPEANIRYHFPVNKSFIPYLGIHAAYYYAHADIDDSSGNEDMVSYGAHVGFKVPVNENVFFDTQLKYTDYNMPWDEIDLSTIQVLLGLNIKF